MVSLSSYPFSGKMFSSSQSDTFYFQTIVLYRKIFSRIKYKLVCKVSAWRPTQKQHPTDDKSYFFHTQAPPTGIRLGSSELIFMYNSFKLLCIGQALN